jgi:hypothetical protein
MNLHDLSSRSLRSKQRRANEVQLPDQFRHAVQIATRQIQIP